MNIVIGTVALLALAQWLWRRLDGPAERAEALSRLRRMVIVTTPRVIVALISAGLFAELLPQEVVRAHLGDTSGIKGVALGAVLGVLTPGGAFVSFALAAGAMQAGATEPAMVAYITAWSLFALTKLIAEEMAFLGLQFLITRVKVTCAVPLVAGCVAMLAG